MVRMARVVAPGTPPHITQRGNRRMETFFTDADYREYLYLMDSGSIAPESRFGHIAFVASHINCPPN